MNLGAYWNLVQHTYVLHRADAAGGWRYGQAAFNVLAEERPDLAEQVRGTDADPFYVTSPYTLDERWNKFVLFVAENW